MNIIQRNSTSAWAHRYHLTFAFVNTKGEADFLSYYSDRWLYEFLAKDHFEQITFSYITNPELYVILNEDEDYEDDDSLPFQIMCHWQTTKTAS